MLNNACSAANALRCFSKEQVEKWSWCPDKWKQSKNKVGISAAKKKMRSILNLVLLVLIKNGINKREAAVFAGTVVGTAALPLFTNFAR